MKTHTFPQFNFITTVLRSTKITITITESPIQYIKREFR